MQVLEDFASMDCRVAAYSRLGRSDMRLCIGVVGQGFAAGTTQVVAASPNFPLSPGLPAPAHVRLGSEPISSHEFAIRRVRAANDQAWTRCHPNGQSRSSHCKKLSFARTSQRVGGSEEPSLWVVATRSVRTTCPISRRTGGAASRMEAAAAVQGRARG